MITYSKTLCVMNNLLSAIKEDLYIRKTGIIYDSMI